MNRLNKSLYGILLFLMYSIWFNKKYNLTRSPLSFLGEFLIQNLYKLSQFSTLFNLVCKSGL